MIKVSIHQNISNSRIPKYTNKTDRTKKRNRQIHKYTRFQYPFSQSLKEAGDSKSGRPSTEDSKNITNHLDLSSVQFSCSVVSDSFRPHELQHARPPCPSPTPRVHTNPCPSSQWCHPTISSSVVPFSCPQSSPASGSFQMSQLFASGGQSYWNFSFNISPSNEHPGLISFRMD